ncbi:MAG: PHP domain-containing protein [Oscillospiraceae bacterium]|jgi:hypothetical protein|nr:PHP domain-containing protein [Oscillospiraceae bacterium]
MTEYVNNHIHTVYSFSPYTPTTAVQAAVNAGLTTAGIMDHDSVSGAREFLRAGREARIGATVGFECRCSLAGTPYENVRVNNPDQAGVAYCACHGIPEESLDAADAWLAPYRAAREKRNRAMVLKLNEYTNDPALALDYEKDVRPISRADEGGSVTERHILFALAHKIIDAHGIGNQTNNDGLSLSEDPYYDYRLLGRLKATLVEKFYIDATDECPPIAEFVSFAKNIGAIPAYPYLGDITESVTGDKKAQTFEDSFLDELVLWLAEIGFLSVTYMPTRNTLPQLERLTSLCGKYGLFQICGEDINTPFQPFVCEKLALPQFAPLVDAAWALIGHERMSKEGMGMFSGKAVTAYPKLEDRIAFFARKGRVSI